MSRFKRGSKTEKETAVDTTNKRVHDDAWLNRPEGEAIPGDPDYDFMRPDKREVSAATAAELAEAKFNTALAMIRSFGYRPWMANVIGPNGEQINTEGEVV